MVTLPIGGGIKMAKRPQYKIAVAGLANAGKTSVVKRLVTGKFEKTKSTRGFDTETVEQPISGSKSIKFQVVDLGGQDVFIHTMWKAFLPQADVLVYVVDADDKEAFEKARDVLHFSISWNPDLPYLMILANKQDLSSAVTADEMLERFNMKTILADCKIQEFRMFGTSAKSGEGINEAFTWMATQLTGQENVPIVNVHGVYVFKKVDSPTMASSTPIAEVAHIRLTSEDEEVVLVPSIYNAIDNFIGGVLEGQISTLEVMGYSSKKYKLVNVGRENHCCLLITDVDDEGKTIKAIGNEVLDYVVQQEENKQLVENETIRDIINPFLVKKPSDEQTTSAESEITAFEPEKKTVIETVTERDRKYVKREFKKGDANFFTKMSVLDRIKAIEDQ
jgi:small GTP-binding protein